MIVDMLVKRAKQSKDEEIDNIINIIISKTINNS